MVFLNPSFLWAAFAVLIPIIVHLFNFRKPKRLNFSSVAFVREVNRSVVRRMRLRQWLLLATRILAILFLVLMFAGPVWVSSPDQAGVGGARSVLVLVDDSPSMQVADSEGSFENQASRMAKTILERGSAQDEFLVLPFSELRPGQPFQKSQEALSRLDQIGKGHNSVPISKIIQILPGLLEKALLPERVVYLLSDCQESILQTPENILTQTEGFTNTRVIVIPVGRTRPANRYIKELALLDPILEKGQANGVKGIIYNQATEKIEDLELSLNLNGKFSGSTRINLEPGDTASFVLNFTPEKSGWNSGYLLTGDGVTAFDDQRYFAFNLPDTNKILVVKGEGLEDKYLTAVLDKVLKQFAFTWVSDKRIGDEDPSKYNAVIFAGVKQIPAGVARKFVTWADEGGSLLLIPHPEQDLSGLNTLVQALSIGQYLPRKEQKEGLEIKPPDASHPLFDGVFRKGKSAKAEGPMVYSWFPFQKGTASGLQEVMKFPDGSPFLWESKVGKGQVMGLSVYPDSKMSDLPLKSIFLPILYRSLLMLTHSSRADLAYELGAVQPVIVKSSGIEVLKLLGENEIEFVPEQFNRPGQVVMNFNQQFPAPGVYEIKGQNISGEKIAFNYPTKESDLSTLRGTELESALETLAPSELPVQVLESSLDNLSKDLEIRETGVPLWKWFLLFVLLFLAVEMLLSYWSLRKSTDELLTEPKSSWKTTAS